MVGQVCLRGQLSGLDIQRSQTIRRVPLTREFVSMTNVTEKTVLLGTAQCELSGPHSMGSILSKSDIDADDIFPRTFFG